MNRDIQQRLQWVKLYKTSGDARMYAVVAAFLAPYYVNGGVEMWHTTWPGWKATAVALKALQQLKLAPLKSSSVLLFLFIPHISTDQIRYIICCIP